MTEYQIGKEIQMIISRLEKLEYSNAAALEGQMDLTIGPIEAFDDIDRETMNEILPRAKTFLAYAPPMVWGTWQTIQSHFGPATFTIEYDPIGSTMVMGQVQYRDANGVQRTEEFHKKITFKTGNYASSIPVRFKGVPLGSAVRGIIK